MIFYYAARERFDNQSESDDGAGWRNYQRWSGLKHVSEIVSLDGCLNGDLVEPDYENADDWTYLTLPIGSHDDVYPAKILNQYGLIDSLSGAINIQHLLLASDPGEHHYNTNIIAIWRHKVIGRIAGV